MICPVKHPFLLGACLLIGGVAAAAMVACGLDFSGLAVGGPDASEAGGPDASEAGKPDASEAGIPDTSVIDTGSIDTGMPEASPQDTGMADTGDGGIADSAMPEAEAGCPGVTCNGVCTTARDCRSCAGAPLFCGSTGQCVAGCEGCMDRGGTALPIECYACDSNAQNPIGSCQYNDAGSYCLSGNYQGEYADGGTGFQCACADADVASCPGATQVCVPLGFAGHSFCLTCGEATIGPIQGQPCRDGGTCQEGQALCQ